MIAVRYVVCSELERKPVTRAICDSRAEAEKVLDRIRRDDYAQPENSYWIAEVGQEADAWRWLGTEGRAQAAMQ